MSRLGNVPGIYFCAPDGDDEPTLWYGVTADDWHPKATLRRRDLGYNADRDYHWRIIVEALEEL